jgi:hypothetical protein
MFATRCMSVKTVPIQHAEVDYAEMCAALQAKVRVGAYCRLLSCVVCEVCVVC